MFAVQVPEGMQPGQQVSVQAPSGQTVLVAIPQGVGPGQIFNVQDPSAVPMAAPVAGAVTQQPGSYTGNVKLEDFLGGDGNNENDKMLPLSGFVLYEMPRLNVPEFKILGDHFNQIIQVELPPGTSMTGEPGSLCNMSDGVKMKTQMGGFMRGINTAISGESLFRNVFTNETNAPGYIGITASFPFMSVVPLHLGALGGSLLCKRGVYLGNMGGLDDVNVTTALSPSLAAGCCGGLGLLLQELSGTGWVFFNACGTLMKKVLAPGESIRVHTHSLVAFQRSVQYDITQTGDCKVMCCAGEGLFNARMTGPGLVFVQSMSKEKVGRLFVKKQNSNNDNGGGGGGGS